MTPRPERGGPRRDLKEAIKDSAWKGIAESGASSLSLRAIARDLGITAPAIYHYFPDRDDLVTELVIDAYTSFGDRQIEAFRQARDLGAIESLTATGKAYREWAIAFPQRYQLIFGTPVPGYRMPLERVRPAGARSLSALLGSIELLRLEGRLADVDLPEIHPSFAEPWSDWVRSSGAPARTLVVAIYVWARVHGLVSLEISGHLPPFGPQGDGLYQLELRSVASMFFLPADPSGPAGGADAASAEGTRNRQRKSATSAGKRPTFPRGS